MMKKRNKSYAEKVYKYHRITKELAEDFRLMRIRSNRILGLLNQHIEAQGRIIEKLKNIDPDEDNINLLDLIERRLDGVKKLVPLLEENFALNFSLPVVFAHLVYDSLQDLFGDTGPKAKEITQSKEYAEMMKQINKFLETKANGSRLAYKSISEIYDACLSNNGSKTT